MVKTKQKGKKAKRNKRLFKYLFLIILFIFALTLFILSSSNVYSLGIRPAKRNIDYDYLETQKNKYYIRIVNSKEAPVTVRIYPGGELKDYLDIEKTIVEISAKSEELVDYLINIPYEEKIEPGKKVGEIIVEETLSQNKSEQSLILTKIRLSQKLYVNVAKPDKYLRTNLSIKQKLDNIEVSTLVENIGREAINNLSSKLSVAEGKKMLKEERLTEGKSLAQGRKEEMVSYLPSSFFRNGSYTIKNLLNYDGNTVELVKELIIGKVNLKASIISKYLSLGEINSFNFKVSSNWNNPIRNIKPKVSLYKEGIKMLQTEGASFDLPPNSEKEIITYLDLRGFERGEYRIELDLGCEKEEGTNYDQTTPKKTIHIFSVSILEPEEIRKKADQEVQKKSSWIQRKSAQAIIYLFLFLAIGFLLIFLFILLFLLYQKHKEKRLKR